MAQKPALIRTCLKGETEAMSNSTTMKADGHGTCQNSYSAVLEAKTADVVTALFSVAHQMKLKNCRPLPFPTKKKGGEGKHDEVSIK